MHLRRAWNEIWPTQVSYFPATSYLSSAKLCICIKRQVDHSINIQRVRSPEGSAECNWK